jgi:hypothetical protein
VQSAQHVLGCAHAEVIGHPRCGHLLYCEQCLREYNGVPTDNTTGQRWIRKLHLSNLWVHRRGREGGRRGGWRGGGMEVGEATEGGDGMGGTGEPQSQHTEQHKAC